MSLVDYHEQFAAVYDTFYKGRPVDEEVAFAAELLQLNGNGGASREVLDFGCGTGSHVLSFARRGVPAVGFDASEAMIAQASAKAPETGAASVRFATGQFDRCFANGHPHHVAGAVSFFNVLNCMDTPTEMLLNLRLIRDVLEPGSLFLAEVWNGAAVFADAPRPDVRHYAVEGAPASEVVRITAPELDRVNQRCTLRYRVLTLNRATGSFTEFESVHTLRFLTPVQYRHLFELADLTLVDEFPKGRPETPVTVHDWYISYLVRRND